MRVKINVNIRLWVRSLQPLLVVAVIVQLVVSPFVA
jgi:hypothetical protein